MNEVLAKVLDFSEADLETNRTGTLTEKQRKIFKRQLYIVRITLIPLLLLVLLPIYDIATTLIQNEPITLRMIRNAVLLGFSSLVFLYYSYQNLKHYQAILDSNEVETVHGVLWQAIERGLLGYKRYFVGIANTKFPVKPEIYDAFIEDELYTLYFADDKILSAEQHFALE